MLGLGKASLRPQPSLPKPTLQKEGFREVCQVLRHRRLNIDNRISRMRLKS